jgi:hypothetical protein
MEAQFTKSPSPTERPVYGEGSFCSGPIRFKDEFSAHIVVTFMHLTRSNSALTPSTGPS